jgi:hypothetical protein
MGDWVGLDAVVKRKIPPELPIIQPVVQCYTTELSRLSPIIYESNETKHE